jgi:triacylglycerol lipase
VLSSLSAPRRRLLVFVVVVVVALVAAAVAVYVRTATTAASDADRPASAPQGRPGPVLLVPGYGGSRTALEALADVLRAQGRAATVLTLPGEGTGDLRQAAAVLDDAADAALAAGAPSVDVVGFSAGGVTARLWAGELGGAAAARRIVTLGSPHHGTDVAAVAAAFAPSSCPQACRQLVPGSALLQGLNGDDETPDGPVWTSVWTEQDAIVTPPESARLQGATSVVVQQVCPGATVDHGSLPRSPVVQRVVLAALGADSAPMSYGAEVCA